MRVILLWLISISLLLHGTEAVSYSLKDGWTLINENRSIEILDLSVPTGVYSDLENANLTESVLFSYNDIKLRWIAGENWTYSLKFEMTSQDLFHKFVILTFNGLDTLTEIFLNGESIGTTDNMFVRYRFNVKEILIAGLNELMIEFRSPIEGAKKLSLQQEHVIPPECPPSVYNGECHMNLLRKMQASFAWDWGLAAPSMGIWKDAYIDVHDTLIIRDITYELIDGIPTEPEEPDVTDSTTDPEETDSTADPGTTIGFNRHNYEHDEVEDEEFWTLKIFVHIDSGLESAEFDGVIACGLVDVDNSMSYHSVHVITNEDGEFTAEINKTINKKAVKMWWPNGYGSQTLYGLKVQWEDVNVNEVSNRERAYFIASKTVKIGFRTIELVQEEMDNGLSFFFKVNGEPIFMKGSNWIPAHILPEKSYEKEKVKELLQAARDANMNMLRVWGGGVYESDYFYSLADEYGILMWQDFMFACAMYPSDEDFLDSVRLEVKMNVRRMQYHPSIAIWATNNENEVALRQNWYGTQSRFEGFADEYRKLYVDTVTDEIKKQDPSREVLTSSPSNGNYNGDREFGIGTNPQDPHFGDIHFYVVDQNAWKPHTFHQPRFSSEYGFQSFPAGWAAVLREGDNLTELVDHRQHHPMRNEIIKFLVEENLILDFNALPWDEKIYLSQLSQAMAIKAETEVYRSGRGNFMNTMGALYWQLNDVWVAPSWSSIEFNGNFKILHHWVQQMFASQTLVTQMTLLDELEIFAISDEINAEVKPSTVRMNLYKWDDVRVVNTWNWFFNMTPNAVTKVRDFDIMQYMSEHRFSVNEFIAEFLLINDEDSNVVSKTYIFPGGFKELTAVADPKIELRIGNNKCDKGSHKVALELKIQAPAIFTYVEFVHEDIKKYRLSKNGFMQFEPIQIVQVTFYNPNCEHTVSVGNFLIKTLNQFLLK